MTELLSDIGATIWRASWQAAVLALLIAIVLRLAGRSIAPRWQFWLLGLVVARLAIVWTPASPLSLFNLVDLPTATVQAAPLPNEDHGPTRTAGPVLPSRRAETPGGDQFANDAHPEPVSPSTPPSRVSFDSAAAVPATTNAGPPAQAARKERWFWPFFIIWIAGTAVFAMRIAWQYRLLQQRISACRAVTDERVLCMFHDLCDRLGVRRRPQLIATPAAVSPCVAGFWKLRVILPESLLTEHSTTEQRHVLAHELAHLARHDVFANWLMLTARAAHWFNPAAWWTFRQMRWHSETASDDLAIAAVGEDQRHAYVSTMLELAANLRPHPIAPGLIGLSSSFDALRDRMQRLLAPQQPRITTPLAVTLLLLLAAAGLTDATSTAEQEPLATQDTAGRATSDQDATAAPQSTPATEPSGTFVINSRCVDANDQSPLSGVELTLYSVTGHTRVRRKVAKTASDAEGRFTFDGLATPQHEDWLNPLSYQVLVRAADRPVMTQWVLGPPFDEQLGSSEIRIPKQQASLAGRVTDEQGRAVADAVVVSAWINGTPLPDDPLTARTGADGRFRISGIPVVGGPEIYYRVVHAEHPELSMTAIGPEADVTVVLPTGCIVTGVVRDEASGQPVAGAVVTATNVSASPRKLQGPFEQHAATDRSGRYRLAVAEGAYNVTANAAGLVSLAVVDRECVAGESIELPAFDLKPGGIISGRVVNTKTGQPIALTEQGAPIALGLLGPSHPAAANLMSPKQMAFVDANGRFQLRAAAGENFPYLTNFHGDRMIWDTLKQPPVIVKDGETTAYDLPVTPKVSAEDKLMAGREIVAALPADPDKRIAQIIVEWRKHNHTVDETEVWCQLMREAVALGPRAVPQLCAELDTTTENRMQRRLGFALRAIGDARAVPALIRAIPRALHPSSSDYGMLVEDPELQKFMQQHDLSLTTEGQYFDLGRPEREIFSALAKLTGQDYGDARTCSLSLSEDPRREALQRRLLRARAQQWANWWQANWQTLTDDPAYQAVNLPADEPLVPPLKPLAAGARLTGEWSGFVLSPPAAGGTHFYDLDTGYQPRWPDAFPQDEAAINDQQLETWAAESGVDLMCVTQQGADGAETYVLRSFGMEVREISERDTGRLEQTVAAGRLPAGLEVDKLLIHFDASTRQPVPDANGCFLYTTREGSRGLIEVTDRVTRTQDLTGTLSPAPEGVGFYKGVRFDLQTIIPQ